MLHSPLSSREGDKLSNLPSSIVPLQDPNQIQPNSTALVPPTLSATHYLVAHKLAQGRSKASISRSLRISPYTINTMLQEPDFILLLESIREDMKLKLTLSREEMQRRLDEDALTSLETIQDIRDGLFGDARDAAVQLKAATNLLDRSTNVPKSSSEGESGATVNIFSPQFIQTLVETAYQVGDKSVFESANMALGTVATEDKVIDIYEDTADYTPERRPLLPIKVPQTKVKTLDELLASSDIFEDMDIMEDDNE